MTIAFSPPMHPSPDLQSLQEAVIWLEPELIEQAIQDSRSAVTESSRWRAYLALLALGGFEQWLVDRLSNGTITPPGNREATNQRQCWALQPAYADLLGSTCQLQVGDFLLNLIWTESVADEVVTLPRAIVDLPEFAAHFYVLLQVQEEQEQVIVRGCLRYDQWVSLQQAVNLHPQPDWTYTLPLNWFDSDSSHLLFYLRFLEPRSLSLPAAAASVRTRLAAVQAELQEQLPQLQAGQTLPEVLTWEQGAALLTCPPLLNLLSSLPSDSEPETRVRHCLTLLAQLAGEAINVWRWLRQTVDGELYGSEWSLPQCWMPAAAMRRTTEKLEAAIADLVQRQVVEIPPQAYYAGRTIAGTTLQLGVVTWHVSDSEWALLLILIAQPGAVLPPGIKLQVGVTTILDEAVLEANDVYLYTLVEGDRSEEFIVTIQPPQGLPLTLPPFACHAE